MAEEDNEIIDEMKKKIFFSCFSDHEAILGNRQFSRIFPK